MESCWLWEHKKALSKNYIQKEGNSAGAHITNAANPIVLVLHSTRPVSASNYFVLFQKLFQALPTSIVQEMDQTFQLCSGIL